MTDTANNSLTLAEVPELRRKTEAVSKFLQQQIAGHFETLRPLFAPERTLGKYAGGKMDVPGMESAMAELRQKYKPFASKPYDLPSELDAGWLPLVGSVLDLHPWEYSHVVQGKAVTMTCPVRWIVNYRASYSLAQVLQTLAGKEAVRPEYLRQFVVNSLVLQLVLSRNTGLKQLFADLRYDLKTETPTELKGLPILTITSSIQSFRPADDVIAAATAFSGVPAFIELIQPSAATSPPDPLREKLEKLLG